MDINYFKRFFVGDTWLWRATLLLMIASIWFVLSASSVLAFQKFGSSSSMIFKHVGMLLASVATACIIARVQPKYFAGLSPLAVFFSFVLLVLVLIIGSKINGSSRWLSVGGITFQPSEIAKIALVIFISRELSINIDNPGNSFWKILICSGFICLPIMLENLSTFLLVALTILFLMIIGRIHIKYWGSLILFGVLFLCFIYFFAPRVSGFFPRAMTWHNRIERFMGLSGEENILDGDYQAHQAQIAVASGGLIGKGLGKSYIKNFLPMAFSDFIFAIILEETGIIGMFIIIGCYFIIMWRSIVIARRCEKPFQMYTILGLSFMICLQAIINMFVGVGIIPVTGQTLPLVSMGGSSNIFTGVAIGIMLSISINCMPTKREEINENEEI